MSDYGSLTGAAAYVIHMTNSSGAFDSTTKPTDTQVTVFLTELCAQLNGWLASAGYVVPVTGTNAKLILDRYANIGAAGLCELTQRSGGYSKDNQNKRENKFLDEFYKADAFIKSGTLNNLDATTQQLPGGLFGLKFGGRTSTNQALRPTFGRTSFGNNPVSESPDQNGEPGY
jgi:hypothetical protein